MSGDIGVNIKKLRKERGLTQNDIAEKLFTTPQNVSRVESGDGEPTVEMLINMADIFNVSVDTLVGRRQIFESEIQIKPHHTSEPLKAKKFNPEYLRFVKVYSRENSKTYQGKIFLYRKKPIRRLPQVVLQAFFPTGLIARKLLRRQIKRIFVFHKRMQKLCPAFSMPFQIRSLFLHYRPYSTHNKN